MILDMTCGGRMMWFNKTHPSAIYVDNRVLPPNGFELRPNFSVQPDVVADFTDLPFANSSFDLVVFDPPHRSRIEGSIIATKYGVLSGDWRTAIRQGIFEGWRVLRPGGTLIFKWAEAEQPIGKILKLFPEITPTFGHTTGKAGKTIWVAFHKSREGANP